MGLNKLTNRIYFLEHDPEVDRPMLEKETERKRDGN